MSLATLLDEIRSELVSIPEVRRVYSDVPDAINEFPAIVVAATGGRCWLASHGRSDGASPMQCEHDIRVELHVPRKDLPADAERITAIAPIVALRLYSGFARDRFNGTMVTTGDPRGSNAQGMMDYAVGPSEWSGQQTYAMMCDFRITTEEEALP